ncbi:MAG: hypothetical protein U0269_17995 [Polyangiales bacterium]
MATSKKSPKPAPLPVPEDVLSIWADIKNKVALQLFHPSPDKRIDAVAALKDKFNYYDRRGALLLSAALAEPDASVRTAMLAAIAHTGSYLSWQDTLRLRANAARFIEGDDLERIAYARCLAESGAPVVEEDLAWLAALVDGAASQEEDAWSVVVRLVVRAAQRGVALDRALALYGRMASHAVHGRRTLWTFKELGEHRVKLVPTLLSLVDVENVCDATDSAAQCLAWLGPTPHDAAVLRALERHRARATRDVWQWDLAIGLVDRASLPARIDRNEAAMREAASQASYNGWVIEPLSWVADRAERFVEQCARGVLTTVAYVSEDTMQRWVRANPEAMAKALEPTLFAQYDGVNVVRWWDQLRPDTAAADALSLIERVLAETPRGTLSYQRQSLCDACCALLCRVRSAPDGAIELLAKLGARQVPHLVGSVIPTARAMHALGAKREDFAPIVQAYEKEAVASDKRASSDPKWDPEHSWGRKLRETATALSALGSIASIRAHWSAFLHVFDYASDLDHRWVLEMLEPHIAEPDVRALFEQSLVRPFATEQRLAAKALGLLRG